MTNRKQQLINLIYAKCDKLNPPNFLIIFNYTKDLYFQKEYREEFSSQNSIKAELRNMKNPLQNEFNFYLGRLFTNELKLIRDKVMELERNKT